MKIAVDFDGTIVEHRYPEIGKEVPFATVTLRKLIDEGHKLILWSVREGKLLDEAVAWCEKRGVHFYAVNKDFDEDTPEKSRNFSRKIKADLFIDDRNVGGAVFERIYRLDYPLISLGSDTKSFEFYSDFFSSHELSGLSKQFAGRTCEEEKVVAVLIAFRKQPELSF